MAFLRSSRAVTALALLPATLVGAAAITLAVVFALIPAVSSIDYLNVSDAVPGASDGDLAIVKSAETAELAIGDVVVADLPGQAAALYQVAAVNGPLLILTRAPAGPAIVASEAVIGGRLSSTIGGLGDFYGYADSAEGWGTVAAVTLAVWGLTFLALRRPRNAPRRPAVRPVARAAAPVPVASDARPPAEAIAPARRAPLPADDNAAWEIASRPAAGVRLDRRMTGRPDIAGDPIVAFAQRVAREAPQHGLRQARRLRASTPSSGAAHWAGLAATAAVVAAATYLVATEPWGQKGQKGQRRSTRRKRDWF